MEKDRTEEGVQEDGKPEEASSASEQAQPDGVIPIDVTRTYKHSRHPEEEIPGDELYATYQRGLQFDKIQSRAQKAEAELKDVQEQLADAQVQVRNSQQRQSVVDSLSELGFGGADVRAGAVRTQEGATDEWYNTPEAQTNERAELQGNHGMAKIIRDIVRDEINLATGGEVSERQEQLITDRVSAIYATDREHREAQQKRQNAIGKIRAAQIANLKQRHPDIDPDKLEAIVDGESAALGNTLKSIEQSQGGDDYGSYETYLDGLEKSEAALDARLEIMLQQRQIDAGRERDAEIEILSGGGLPAEDTPKRRTLFKRKEVDAAREEGVEGAHKTSDRLSALKNTGMRR